MATVLPNEPVTLSADEVRELHEKLRKMRHDINNYLTVIVGHTELIRLRPEALQQHLTALSPQPPRILESVREFSAELEKALKISRSAH